MGICLGYGIVRLTDMNKILKREKKRILERVFVGVLVVFGIFALSSEMNIVTDVIRGTEASADCATILKFLCDGRDERKCDSVIDIVCGRRDDGWGDGSGDDWDNYCGGANYDGER